VEGSSGSEGVLLQGVCQFHDQAPARHRTTGGILWDSYFSGTALHAAATLPPSAARGPRHPASTTASASSAPRPTMPDPTRTTPRPSSTDAPRHGSSLLPSSSSDAHPASLPAQAGGDYLHVRLVPRLAAQA